MEDGVLRDDDGVVEAFKTGPDDDGIHAGAVLIQHTVNVGMNDEVAPVRGHHVSGDPRNRDGNFLHIIAVSLGLSP